MESNVYIFLLENEKDAKTLTWANFGRPTAKGENGFYFNIKGDDKAKDFRKVVIDNEIIGWELR